MSEISVSLDSLDERLIELLKQRVFAVTGDEAATLSADALAAILREVDYACMSAAAPVRAAYLGPPHSYSHQAALHAFGASAELAPVATIPAVFEEVEAGHCRFGVAPIENSTDGRIADTLDTFTRTQVRISGELPLAIHHHLLAACSREGIREVHSKPQALSQCRRWLSQHLPQAELVDSESTAAAARLAGERSGIAAVASRDAAKEYGVPVVAENIEDNAHNVTRFAIISREETMPTGRDKTAIMFQVRHQPGALVTAMQILKNHGLNMTWIESFPMAGRRAEYVFFVEYEGHEVDEVSQAALCDLLAQTERLRVLGSYATMGVVEG